VLLPTHRDGRERLFRGELPGVAEAVFQGHSQKRGAANGG
jgi:hypothetical protein